MVPVVSIKNVQMRLYLLDLVREATQPIRVIPLSSDHQLGGKESYGHATNTSRLNDSRP